MTKILKNNSGISLVEVLASIVIFSIFSIIVFNVFIKGSETASNINTDTELRDEADLIMSRLIKILYSTNQNTIVRNTTNENGSYLEITTDLNKCQKDDDGNWIINSDCLNTLKKIGFQNNGRNTDIILKDEKYILDKNNIRILSDSKIEGDPNKDTTFKILLTLENSSKYNNNFLTKKMSFANTIQPLFSKEN